MALQTGQQIITIHFLPNISRSKGNQAMKVGQLRKYSARNICFKNRTENEVQSSSRDLFVILKKHNRR